MILSKNIVVYGRATCRYCDLAKRDLDLLQLEYVYKDVDEALNLQELKLLVPRVSQIPQIFIDDKHVGGYFELSKLLIETGK